MRILVVDDNKDIREFLKRNLESECFVVDTAGDGEQGSYMGRVNEYDAILLDNVMPKKSGLEVCREIRATGKTCPVVILSVQSETDDKINLLDGGADDYVTKPFSYKELSSRLRALLRRPKTILKPIITIDDFELDTVNQRAKRGKRRIYLTRKEFALTEHLMRHSGDVVSRGSLLEHVWNDEIDPFSNTVEAHILNLRKKIDKSAQRKLIHTIPGRGYKMDILGRV
jgi:two-component system, OmpR family, copper resistance phosphate regulon response regulator CusR